jgi:hypothetical protein
MKIISLHWLAFTSLLTIACCGKSEPSPRIEYLRQEFHIQLPQTTHTTTTVQHAPAVTPSRTEPLP